MKPMILKSKLSSIISRICAAALALLGYNCSSFGEIPDMYGTPTGSFEVKGAVTNEEDVPISDAEIRVCPPKIDSSKWSIAVTETSNEGTYIVEDKSYIMDSIKVVCVPKGKEYLPDSIKLPVKYVKDKEHKKDTWYFGHAEMTVDFKLKKNKGE